ncbi:cobalamin biosynthesis protein [Fulvimarina endophytica]|uniref:Cobalamin biosynthesis protein CobD n=1 Tax=Fulvimarina endophytica TaxID=2293836 RepID=A0A371WYM2_9HYPH|nr:adenosylcobinamide-phosphate synthase CbiB [Fulvimarina endophytica]RFC62090.1 cobalamin biosynthesis protein [Fulvimarina endophytica]
MTAHLAILFLATLLDRIVGDPPELWRRLRHPVVLVGGLIAVLDRSLNDPHLPSGRRRLNGCLLALLLVLGGAILGLGLSALFSLAGIVGAVFEIVLVAVFLAQKSLLDHVGAVETALKDEGLEAGRAAVAQIVGRDVSELDEAGVCRAAIESLAENTSDGIVAPFLFYLVLGLPGLLVYKAVNTADSMVGHLDETYRDFGWASARLDDLLNLVPARLTARLYVRLSVPGGRPARRAAMDEVRRDARLHRSPNAGWPESALARGLAIALGGPRRYRGLHVEAPFINANGRRAAIAADIAAGTGLTRRLFDRLLWIAGLAMLASLLLSAGLA